MEGKGKEIWEERHKKGQKLMKKTAKDTRKESFFEIQFFISLIT